MGKHKKVFAEAVSEMKHFLLGAALVLTIIAVVPVLAQEPLPPPPDGGTYTAPPPPPPDGGTYTPPPDGSTYTQPTGTYIDPTSGTQYPMPSGTQYPMPSGTQMQPGMYPSGGQYPTGSFGPDQQFGGTPCQPGQTTGCGPTSPQGQMQYDPSKMPFPGQGQGNQGQFPGRGFGPQEGFGPPPGFGSREEYQDHFQEQFRNQDSGQNDRQLKDMQRGVKGFTQGLNMFEKMITKGEKQGVAAPAIMLEALAKGREISSAVQNAKTLEEVLDAPMDEMPDIMETLQDGERVYRFTLGYSKMRPRIERQAKSLEKQLDRALKVAKRSNVDVSSYAQNVRALISENITKPLADLSAAIKAGDVELDSIFETTQGIQESFEEISEKIGVIQLVAKSSRLVKNTERSVKRWRSSLQRLERSESDADLEAINDAIADVEDALAAVKTADLSDADGYLLDMEDLFFAQDAVNQAFAEAQGRDLPKNKFDFLGGAARGGQQLFQEAPQGLDIFLAPQAPQPTGDF